jgi:hypothetical protein
VFPRLEQHALGDLEHEASGIDVMLGNGPAQRSLEVGVAELDRREIHRDLQLRPTLGIPHRPVEDPLPERGKEAGILGDRDEVCGRHLSMLRMAPAQ